MKQVISAFLVICFIGISYSQDAEAFYNKAMAKAEAGELEEAIELLGKSIELNDTEYVAWYNRGIARNALGLYEESLADFERTLELYPTYKKGYLNRGTTKKHLTDYEGAIADYTKALELDSAFTDAYYNRGLVYELLGKKDLACADFAKARTLGMERAQRKVDQCNDTSDHSIRHSILRLEKTASDDTYGFSQDNPIRVGTGPDGGPANQHTYLDLLRDAQGKPVKYERQGSCCAYDSPNGFLGTALLDIYVITYLDAKGKKKTKSVYISFYDYEEPMILQGFKTVGQP
jgi:tetratricopeptide (TPR) repeat protein